MILQSQTEQVVTIYKLSLHPEANDLFYGHPASVAASMKLSEITKSKKKMLAYLIAACELTKINSITAFSKHRYTNTESGSLCGDAFCFLSFEAAVIATLLTLACLSTYTSFNLI